MPYRNKTPDQIRRAIAESAITETTRPRKTPTAEIVAASEGAIIPPRSREDVETMIARIVRERVDEIMVKVEAGQLEPDFLLKDEAAEVAVGGAALVHRVTARTVEEL